jgi:hypothetical protein
VYVVLDVAAVTEYVVRQKVELGSYSLRHLYLRKENLVIVTTNQHSCARQKWQDRLVCLFNFVRHSWNTLYMAEG